MNKPRVNANAAAEATKARKVKHPNKGVGKRSRRYVHNTGKSEKAANKVNPPATIERKRVSRAQVVVLVMRVPKQNKF